MGKYLFVFNSTFIALIPEKDSPKCFEYVRSITLCNSTYNIIAKVISTRIKRVLNEYISEEQFGFLSGRQIHEANGVAQEGLHTIKCKKMKAVMIKLDFSKAYDRVSWNYVRVVLSQMGFAVPFIS